MACYLVTGAEGGMGKAVCRALTDAGHRVWGIDRTVPPEDRAWRLLRADVTRTGEIGQAAETVRLESGGLDGIIHAAGVYDLNSLVEISEEDFLRDFDVNLFGAYRVNRLFLPLLREKARIVMVSSELAPLRPLPFTGIYAVTKGALEKYAASLRMELQLLGFSVIVIRPGAVNTGMLPASVGALDRFCENTQLYSCNAKRFRSIVNRVESRGVEPEKIAETVSRSLTVPRPKTVYKLNRSPLLLLFGLLPERLQLWGIRKVCG